MKKLVAAFGLLVASMLVYAQASLSDFPNKPIKLMVPFGPGGASDNVARILALKMSDILGQQVVVDNRPGAAGNIAVEAVAKSQPDGYSILLGNVSTNAINPTTYASILKVNAGKDLTGVSMVAAVPHVIAASAKFPPNNIAELVEYAKVRPGVVNYASAGPGSYPMIDMLVFETAAGLKMVHVPFKGGAGQFVVAMISNDVQLSFVNASSVLPLIRANRLKALAVTTAERMPELPNVQTTAEAGYPGVGTNAWQGLFVASGTPKAIIQKLHAAVQSALANPELKSSFAKMTIMPRGSETPEAFNSFVADDAAKWAQTVKKFNVSLDQ